MSWKAEPRRHCIPFSAWPSKDKRCWELAIAKGDILDGRGPASHWAEETKRTNVRHYGRWLGYLKYVGIPYASIEPDERVTPETVKAYSSLLAGLVAPMTRSSMLVGMKEVVRAMYPEGQWRWLQDYCNAIQRQARPTKNKHLLIRSSREIYQAALGELNRLVEEADTVNTRVKFRDTLMLALCVSRPLRVRNLGGITIGKNLLRSGEQWLLVFVEDETKNQEPLEFFVPESLAPYLERYLETVRPQFPGAANNLDLWLSKDDPCKDRRYPYWWIRKTTKRLIGTTMNPHPLRDCVATDLAENSPDSIGAAAIMLGHRHLSTTEKYYVHAKNLQASRKINSILDDLKTSLETQ